MAIHPSLSSSESDKKSRSVLKRVERIRMMMEKGQWKEGEAVYGLPKIKTVRIKIKKEKAAAKKTEAVAVTEGAAPATAPETKEQPAKGPAAKSQAKQEKK